jgi:tRNA (uracil-5-)-methyltransferase TRM9
MDPAVVSHLIDLNRRFYEQFGPAFAATRRRVQDGVRRALADLSDDPACTWLDLGCGAGALAALWLRSGRRSGYLGLDFSVALLAEARQAVAAQTVADGPPAEQAAPGDAPPNQARITFRQADLSDPRWADGLDALGEPFGGALAFAVFHHLPSSALRLAVLRRLRGLLPVGALFVHSEWQFQHSEKLMARRLPWSAAGLREDQLEPGDTLLDWRAALPGQAEQVGLRYVHLFSREELAALAADAGFEILDEYESDGQGGRLGLYQRWRAV